MGQTISEKKVEKQGVPKKGQKQAHRTVPQEGKDNEPQIVDRDLREDPKHLTTAQRESRIANVRYESAAQQSTVKDSRTLQELSSHNEIHSTNATGRRCSQYWEASQPCDHVSKIAALEQEIAVLQQSAHRNMLQFKLYDRKIEKLNDIILNQSAKHEQDDDKIIEDSQAIRREIEGIILKNYVITSLDREVQAYETSAKQNWPQELFDSFLNASSYGRLYLIRSYVFKQINHDIFNGTLFGLDGDMEKQMQEFEKVIMASKHGLKTAVNQLYPY